MVGGISLEMKSIDLLVVLRVLDSVWEDGENSGEQDKSAFYLKDHFSARNVL